MFSFMRLAPVALGLLAALSFAPAAKAVTVGLPILTTQPGTITFTNNFSSGLPSLNVEMRYTGLIATAQGAAELVGKSLSFFWDFNGDRTQLIIDGVNLRDPLDNLGTNPSNQYRIYISPPVDTETPTGTTGVSVFTYLAPFNGFGPYETANFPPFRELLMAFSGAIPTKTGYLYCGTGEQESFCRFLNSAGVTQIDGIPVVVFQTFVYQEGELTNATLTFSTVDGRALAPVPLPAAGVLLVLALGGLAAAGRARRSA